MTPQVMLPLYLKMTPPPQKKQTNKADCSEAARRLSKPTYDKPGMHVAFRQKFEFHYIIDII